MTIDVFHLIQVDRFHLKVQLHPAFQIRNHLKPNDPSDNDDIRHINAKSIINPLINTDGVGLDRQKLQDYVDLIPPEEISEDIANMFEFIKENLT